MKKVITWIIIALVVFMVVRDPAQSAAAVRNAWGGLVSLGAGFGSFISHVASG